MKYKILLFLFVFSFLKSTHGLPQLLKTYYNNVKLEDQYSTCDFKVNLLMSNDYMMNTSSFEYGPKLSIDYNRLTNRTLDGQYFVGYVSLSAYENLTTWFKVDNIQFDLGPFNCIANSIVDTVVHSTIYDRDSITLVSLVEFKFNDTTAMNKLDVNWITCDSLREDYSLACTVRVLNKTHFTLGLQMMGGYLERPSSYNVSIFYKFKALPQLVIPNLFPFMNAGADISILSTSFYPSNSSTVYASYPGESFYSVGDIEIMNAEDSVIYSTFGTNFNTMIYPLLKNSTYTRYIIRDSIYNDTLTNFYYSNTQTKSIYENLTNTFIPKDRFVIPFINPFPSSYFQTSLIPFGFTSKEIFPVTLSSSTYSCISQTMKDIIPVTLDLNSKLIYYNIYFPVGLYYTGGVNIDSNSVEIQSSVLVPKMNGVASSININKIDILPLSDTLDIYRFNVTSYYPLLYIILSNLGHQFAYLSNSTSQYTIYELISPKLDTPDNVYIFMDLNNTQVVLYGNEVYNSNFDFVPILNNSNNLYLLKNINRISSIRFKSNTFDFSQSSETMFINELYFEFDGDQFKNSEIVLEFIRYGLTYPAVYNHTTNEFKVEFNVYSQMLPGDLAYTLRESKYKIFTHESFNIISVFGQSLNLTISNSYGDILAPQITQIKASPSTTVQNYGKEVEIGWELTINDYPNGFKYGTVDLVSNISIMPITITFNESNIMSGDQYSGVYLVKHTIGNYRTLHYWLTNLKLYDNSPFKVQSQDYDQFDWIQGINITERIIVVLCNATVEDVKPTTLSITGLHSLDFSSPDRDPKFVIKLNDPSGISPYFNPYVLLLPDFGDSLKVPLNRGLVENNGATVTFYSNFTLPYSFSNTNILVSLLGIVDNFGNINGYSAMNIPTNARIMREYKLETPFIEDAYQVDGLNPSLTLLGKTFGIDKDGIEVLVKNEGDIDFTVFKPDFISGLAIRVNDIGPIYSSIIYVQVRSKYSGYTSAQFMVDAINSKVRPTPSPTQTPSVTPTQTTPPISLCPGTPACNGRGTCKSNGCVCNYPYYGPSCSSQTIPIKPPLPQPDPTIGTNITGNTNNITSMIEIIEVREIDNLNNIIQRHSIEKWNFTDLSSTSNKPTYLYQSQLNGTTTNITVTIEFFENSTEIEFGNQNITISPSSIKYSIELSSYPFTSKVNLLQVIMESTIIGTSSDSCSSQQFGSESDSKDDIKWIKMNIDKTSLYGRFIDIGIIDGRVSNITNRIIEDNDESTTTTQFRSMKVGITLPNYDNSVYLDPDFSNLIDVENEDSDFLCKSKKKLSSGAIAGIVVGGVVFLSLVIGGVMFVHKRNKMRHEQKKMENKLKKMNNAKDK